VLVYNIKKFTLIFLKQRRERWQAVAENLKQNLKPRLSKTQEK